MIIPQKNLHFGSKWNNEKTNQSGVTLATFSTQIFTVSLFFEQGLVMKNDPFLVSNQVCKVLLMYSKAFG